jgi:hypothetical protein
VRSVAWWRRATAAIMQSTSPRGRDASLAAAAVDPCGTLEVGDGVETVQMEPQQKAAQVRLPGIAARAGQDFHDHRLGHGDRAVGGNQF